MTLITEKNTTGESILAVNNPYNYSQFKHPEISIKIEVTKLDGTKQEMVDQSGVFNLGKLDNGTYNVQLFSISSQIPPPGNQSSPRVDSFEITDTTTPTPTSTPTTASTPTTGTQPTPTPAPSAPGRLGSALGIAPKTKITGDFTTGFQNQVSSVAAALSDTNKLRQEVTNLLANWPEVSATITTKFNPKKIIDDELKGPATNIVGSLSNLNQIRNSPIDEAVDKFTPELTLELATVIVAYNVDFEAAKTPQVPPQSGSGTPLDDEGTVVAIDKEEEDREVALQREADQLEGMVRKGEKDLTGLLNLLKQPVQDENAVNKKKLVLSQLQQLVSDFETFKSHLERAGVITVHENSMKEVKDMQEKAAAQTPKEQIAMPAGWNKELFRPVNGIGKFNEFESQLKKVNKLIDEHNDKIGQIRETAGKINTADLEKHLSRIGPMRAQVEEFDGILKNLQQQINTTDDAKQLEPLFTQLGKALQDNYEYLKTEKAEILSLKQDVHNLTKEVFKVTRIGKKSLGVSGWFGKKSEGLTEESKKLNDQREYLEELLKAAKETATPTTAPGPTPVPTPPTIAPEQGLLFPNLAPNVPLKETETLKTISVNADMLYGAFTRKETIGGTNKSPQQVLQELSKEGPIDNQKISQIMTRLHSLRSKRVYKKDITNLTEDLIALERYLKPAYELLHSIHRNEKVASKGNMDKTRTKQATTARANRIGELIRQTRALLVQVNQYIKENS